MLLEPYSLYESFEDNVKDQKVSPDMVYAIFRRLTHELAKGKDPEAGIKTILMFDIIKRERPALAAEEKKDNAIWAKLQKQNGIAVPQLNNQQEDY